MREIKFRAWDFPKNKMYEVNTLGLPGATFTHFGEKHIQTNTDDGSEYETTFQVLDKFVLMQYTGLKDKKGKEIYEGDMVREWLTEFAPSELIYKVGFDRGHFTLTNIEDGYNRLGIWNVHGNMEVIGNIHENPELISKEV